MAAIVEHARRRLAQRMRQFLDDLGRQGREPNRLEGHCLLDALAYLHGGQYQLSDEAIQRAEAAGRADQRQLSQVRPSFDPVTIARLRAHLTAIELSAPQEGP